MADGRIQVYGHPVTLRVGPARNQVLLLGEIEPRIGQHRERLGLFQLPCPPEDIGNPQFQFVKHLLAQFHPPINDLHVCGAEFGADQIVRIQADSPGQMVSAQYRLRQLPATEMLHVEGARDFEIQRNRNRPRRIVGHIDVGLVASRQFANHDRLCFDIGILRANRLETVGRQPAVDFDQIEH